MSRAYRIRVSRTLTRTLHVEDGICEELEILDVLSRERMSELLAAALEKRGFVRTSPEHAVLELQVEPEISLRVDGASARLEARVAGESRVALERAVSRAVAHPESGRAALERAVDQSLEAEAQREADRVRQGLSARLEDALLTARPLIEQALNEATAEALKIRAGELGEIESIEEDAEGGALVIRVKV